MIWSNSFSFLFLLLFPQQGHVKSFAVSKSHGLWSDENKANAFMQCFIQNMDRSPVLSQEEKEYAKSTTETMIFSMSNTASFPRRNTADELQTIKMNFAMSVVEYIKETDGTKFKAASFKIDYLLQTLGLCYRTTLGIMNKQFIPEIKKIIRRFSGYALVNKDVISTVASSADSSSFASSSSSVTGSSSVATITFTNASSTVTGFSSISAPTTTSSPSSVAGILSVASSPITRSLFSVSSPSSASRTVLRTGYDIFILPKKRRSIRRKRESITITDRDIQTCANAVKANLEDESKEFESCYKIFNRGEWDDKADRTLDGDIRKLIRLIYDNKRENLEKVLYFIDKYVPKYVRELIVCYHTLINQFEKNDFTLPMNQPYFKQIKNSVKDIKNMNGGHPAERYYMAKQIHKDMLENILESLNFDAQKESISITDQDIQDCVNSFEPNLDNEQNVILSCSKIFNRGAWDEKADRTLDGDIRKLIRLIYDGKRENLVKVLYFIDKYVPKYVRELIVCYDEILNEFGKKEDFNLPSYQLYFQVIKNNVISIKNMNGDESPEKYQLAKQIHKDMLESILVNLNVVTQSESISVEDQDIRNCSNSVKLNFEKIYDVFVSCYRIFSRGVWDEKADKTLDGDIRKLIRLIYDGKRENLMKVLYYIENSVPRNVRELIVSYDTIINEFEKNEDFNLPINQPYFQQVKDSVRKIKNMNGRHPAEKYDSTKQVYKDMLNNIFNNLHIVSKRESSTIVDQDLQNCANSVKLKYEDDPNVFASCSKIFNRGIWDAKADRTLDGDIRKLIRLMYDGERENIKKVLYFIDKHVPKYVRELIVSYNSIINEFEKSEDFNLPSNQPYFQKIKHAVSDIKSMNGNHPAEKYYLAKQVHKDMLENMLENLNKVTKKESISIEDQDIQNCANSVKLNSEDESEVFVSCNKIFNRGVLDEKADKTLDADTKKLMRLIYDDKRENLIKVLHFIDKYVPERVRELIISYDTIISEFEKNEDFNLPMNQPYFQQLYDAVTKIKNMNGELATEKFSLVQQTLKDMLENILKKFDAIKGNNAETKGNVIQNCIQAIREETSNTVDLCNQIFKKENNREWFPSDDVLWLDSDLNYTVREAYNGKRDNFVKVLTFLRHKCPYIEQTAKGYKILLDEMEKNQPLSNLELTEFTEKVKESLNDSDSSTKAKTAFSDILNGLVTRFEALKETVIRSCVIAIKKDLTWDFKDAVKKCNEIIKKEKNRAWVSGKDYYEEDLKKIVKLAYSGKEENLDKLLKYVRDKFPYSYQDLLGYSTLLEELKNNEQLKVRNLNKLLEKVISSKSSTNLPYDTEKKFQKFQDSLQELIKVKEDQVFEVFIQAILKEYFTEEENKQWKEFYGGENDYRTDWLTYGYVEKFIVYTYDGKQNNFEDALNTIRKFNFADQMVVGYRKLLNEMEKVQVLNEDTIKIFEDSIKVVEAGDLTEEYQNKYSELKERLKNLQDLKKVNEEDAVRECIEAIQNKKWVKAKARCNKIFLSKPIENLSDGIFAEKDELQHIVNTIYDGNLANTDHVLKLVSILPYIYQNLNGYRILLNEIKKKDSDKLYYSALNQLKEKIKEIEYSDYFEGLREEHKRRFAKLRKDITELIRNFIATKKVYTAPKEYLKYSNGTIINVENINIKVDIHYDLPPYFSDYPFEDELKRIYKAAKECATDYKDFVLPDGWMSDDDEAQVDIWVFNDLDIFGHRSGFASYSPKHNEFLAVDGMYLYRKRENEARVQYFKHEFMHVLVFGGIGKLYFVKSVPRWFHDGLAELAEHGPCNTNQLNLMQKDVYTDEFRKKRDVFMKMICMSAAQQKEEYADDHTLNYYLSYFNVLYLRMRHPEFLREIMLEIRESGWEGLGNTFTSNVRKKVCDHFKVENETFFSWMENSAKNHSFCYSDQPDGKFKLTYIPDTPAEGDHELSFSVFSGEKFSWKNLIDAFHMDDSVRIDKQIEIYRDTLKKQIEKLNLIPLNEDLKPQKSFMNTVLRFLDEIHSRREEISIGYYYFHANSFLKLVFEDIILPSYQRASLAKEKAFTLKEVIQLEFKEFLRKAFTKDQPPDHKVFLSWYSDRCREIGFCTPENLDEIEKLMDVTKGETEDFEISYKNEKPSHYQDNRAWMEENYVYHKTLVRKEANKDGWEAISYILPILGMLGIVAAAAYRNQIRYFLRKRFTPNNRTSTIKKTEVVIPVLIIPSTEAIS